MGAIGLLYTFAKYNQIKSQAVGTDRMKKIAGHISEGSLAFLKAEYKILAIFAISIALVMGATASGFTSSLLIGVSYLAGVIFSALAGFVGMKVAAKANVRSAHAAETGLENSFRVAFTGGVSIGLATAG